MCAAVIEARRWAGTYPWPGEDPVPTEPCISEDVYHRTTAVCFNPPKDAPPVAALAQTKARGSLVNNVRETILPPTLNDEKRDDYAFWWLWELTTMRGDADEEESNWLAATYECDFIRAADGWKIKHLVLEVKKVVPYQDVPSEIAP